LFSCVIGGHSLFSKPEIDVGIAGIFFGTRY
jgi:hypothetical protein